MYTYVMDVVFMYVCMLFVLTSSNSHRSYTFQVSVLLESLREQEQSMQHMLVFFDEISALKSHQGQGRAALLSCRWSILYSSSLGQAFIPWALRVLGSHSQDTNDAGSPSSAGQKPRRELKRTDIQKKLNKIVKVYISVCMYVCM